MQGRMGRRWFATSASSNSCAAYRGRPSTIKRHSLDPFIKRFSQPRFFVNPSSDAPLKGLRFAAKDNLDVRGTVTGVGSPKWASQAAPATRDALIVEELLRGGACLVGKTHMDELAYSISGDNWHYGDCLNPKFPGLAVGGSSSGSAAAVAEGEGTGGKFDLDFSLGTDTCGSVRVPAAYCGLFGIRTTHGLVRSEGLEHMAESFDSIGWFSRDADMLCKITDFVVSSQAATKGAGGEVERVFAETASSSSSFSSSPFSSGVERGMVRKIFVAEDLLANSSLPPKALKQLKLKTRAAAAALSEAYGASIEEISVEAWLREQLPDILSWSPTSTVSEGDNKSQSPPSSAPPPSSPPSALAAATAVMRTLIMYESWQALGRFYEGEEEQRKLRPDDLPHTIGLDVAERLQASRAVGRIRAAEAAEMKRKFVGVVHDALLELDDGGSALLLMPTIPGIPPAAGLENVVGAQIRTATFELLAVSGLGSTPQAVCPLGSFENVTDNSATAAANPPRIPLSLSVVGPRYSDVECCRAVSFIAKSEACSSC